MADYFSAIFGRTSSQSARQAPNAAQEQVGEAGPTVRYRAGLIADIQHGHAAASRHVRALLDACRIHNMDAAIVCMRQFADDFRQIGLLRSVLLYPYLRWALERDRVATIQFKSTCFELERSTLLIEAILTDYLHAPWDSDRRRRFVHDVVRIASLFSHAARQEISVLLPVYLAPGQYRYVVSAASV